jgi:hypothetical protein
MKHLQVCFQNFKRFRILATQKLSDLILIVKIYSQYGFELQQKRRPQQIISF